MKLITVKTPELLPGDQIDRYAGAPLSERETITSVEMPAPGDGVLATVRTNRTWFWSGVQANHVVYRMEGRA